MKAVYVGFEEFWVPEEKFANLQTHTQIIQSTTVTWDVLS